MVAIVILAGGCSASSNGGVNSAQRSAEPADHGTTSTTSTTVAPATSTTAPPVPSSPQPSAEAAASDLVSAWAAGNDAQAHTLATPQAVATLFATPYPPGLAIARGCSSGVGPIVCTYGPPGGGPANAHIYQLHMAQAPGGWYVSSVQVE